MGDTHTAREVYDGVDAEGLDYYLQHYTDPGKIEDPELRAFGQIAALALDAFEARLREILPESEDEA